MRLLNVPAIQAGRLGFVRHTRGEHTPRAGQNREAHSKRGHITHIPPYTTTQPHTAAATQCASGSCVDKRSCLFLLLLLLLRADSSLTDTAAAGVRAFRLQHPSLSPGQSSMALATHTHMQQLHQHGATSSSHALSPGLSRGVASRSAPAVACSAAGSLAASTSGAGALASYAWPKATQLVRQQPVTRSPAKLWSTQMWFEAMVQTVVKQLDGGPFLLCVCTNPVLSLQLIRLEAADLAAGWEHIQQRHLGSAPQQDEAVILVHPVASADRPCLVRQAAGEACPGCPHTAPSEVSPAAAAAAAARGGSVTAGFCASSPPPATPTELLHGKFGDCCRGGEGGHAHHHHHPQHSGSSTSSSSSGQQQQREAATAAAAAPSDAQTAFYGLVVQTRNVADPLQGCYLLKTMKLSSDGSSSSDCQCTHYSVSQVCKGPSLQQQYQASWLV